MEEDGYITPAQEPTEWVNSMVVSLKNDKVCICIGPKDLNKAIKREHHPMRTIDEIITEIPKVKMFSVRCQIGFPSDQTGQKVIILKNFQHTSLQETLA